MIPESVVCGYSSQFVLISEIPCVSLRALTKHSVSTSFVFVSVPSMSKIARFICLRLIEFPHRELTGKRQSTQAAKTKVGIPGGLLVKQLQVRLPLQQTSKGDFGFECGK